MKDKLSLNLDKSSEFIKKHLIKICVINSIVFGNLHLLNYSNSVSEFVWDGYIDFVRTFSGLVLCLIRVRMGLGYAIFYHGLSNAILFFIKYRYEIGNLIDQIF
jgi:membrane protease YdiL (CAAX protease family)